MKRFILFTLSIVILGSVSSTTTKTDRLEGDGDTTEFDFSFPYTATSQVKVDVVDPDTDEPERQTETTDYSVSPSKSDEGGTVTFDSAPDSGDLVVISRTTSNTQQSDIDAQVYWINAKTAIENALDKLTRINQEQSDGIERSLRAPVTDIDFDGTLPGAASRASKYLAFDSDGNIEMSTGTGGGGGDCDVNSTDETHWNLGYEWGGNLNTLSGVDANSTDLGEFTGDTIGDSNTIQEALQLLETAVESAGGHEAVTFDSNMAGIFTLSTQQIEVNLVSPTNGRDDALSTSDDIRDWGVANYQPLESTLTDIADGTIAENLVNTSNPWADNEVSPTLTIGASSTVANGALDNDLQTLAGPTAHRLFYSNGSQAITELAYGSDGQYLKSNGASSAPSWVTPAGAGDMLKATYDADDDDYVDGNDTAYNSTSWNGNTNAASMNAIRDKIESLTEGHTEEEIEDFAGGMLGGTETHITVTYQDATNDIDFVVDPGSVVGAVTEGAYKDSTVTSADVKDGELELADMNNLNVFADEDVLTYESGNGGGFEGMTIDELLANATEGAYADSSVTGSDIKDDSVDSGDYNTDSIDNEHVNWTDIDYLSNEGKLVVGDNESTNENNLIAFVADANGAGNQILETDGNLYYNPSSGTITSTAFSGDGSALTDVAADTGDSATNFFNGGTLELDYGGLGINASAFSGFLKVSGGTTSALDPDAGTDVTADLEEETHASEHAVGGADTVFPADPDADKVLMWDDDPGELIFTDVGVGDMLKATYDNAENGYIDGNDTAYDSSWDSNPDAASMNAVYDAVEDFNEATVVDTNSINLTISSDELTADVNDRDYGDITVSNTGSDWTIDDGTIELVDMNNINTFADEDVLTYETGSGGGFEGMTIAELLATGSSTSLSDTADLLYESELDALSELTSQIADVTKFYTDDDIPAAGTDPDVDAVGEISIDTDGGNEPNSVTLRVTDTGGDTQYIQADSLKHFPVTIISPDTLPETSFVPILPNKTGFTFHITKISGESDIDDFDFTLKERDADGANVTTIEAVQLSTDGTAMYYGSVVAANIDHAIIENGHSVGFDNSTDDANYVLIIISGYFDGDVD